LLVTRGPQSQIPLRQVPRNFLADLATSPTSS